MRSFVFGRAGSLWILGICGAISLPVLAEESQPRSWSVTPYGLVTLNGAFVSGAVNNLDVPYWATASFGQASSNELNFTARQSRFGIKGDWATPPSALGVTDVTGVFEIDLYGGFANQGLGYYFPIPRLRLAAGSVSWGSTKLTIGQDWAIVAPLNPDSALHVAVPGFTATGNLWARMPQIRVEGSTGGELKLVWAAGVLADAQADAIPAADSTFTTLRKPEGGENSLVPAIEARVGVAGKVFDRPFGVGISGHFGRRNVATYAPATCPTAPCPPNAWAPGAPVADSETTSYAAALDVSVPIGSMAAVKGEAYYGQGMDAYFGGANQGFNVSRDALGNLTAVNATVRSVGGWGQATVKPLKWFWASLGFGIDSPNSSDLPAFDAAKKNDTRVRNLATYAAATVELAEGFTLNLEYDYLNTLMQSGSLYYSNVVALTGQLSF